MADTTDTDVLMYFLYKGSDAIAAESTSIVESGDKLMSDFKVGKFFEAESFSFAIKLEDDEGKSDKPGAKAPEQDRYSGQTQSYARWRSLKQDTAKPTPPFRAEPDDFSVTRMIDSSSPILLNYCLGVQRLDKAVLVKRARVASTGGLVGFLRMEFAKIYIKSIQWTEGDVVKETCKFKYASLNVTYLKRQIGAAIPSSSSCSWEPATNA